MSTYAIYEGSWFSWKGFKYYLKNRKKLTKETFARILTTRDDRGFSSRSIFRTIDSILAGAYWVRRKDGGIGDITPLTKLQPGDVIVCSLFLFCLYWEYDGKRAIFVGES